MGWGKKLIGGAIVYGATKKLIQEVKKKDDDIKPSMISSTRHDSHTFNCDYEEVFDATKGAILSSKLFTSLTKVDFDAGMIEALSKSKRAKITTSFVRGKGKTTVNLNMIGKGLSFGYYDKKLSEILDNIEDSITEEEPIKEKKRKVKVVSSVLSVEIS
jgi:hypothetical protein